MGNKKPRCGCIVVQFFLRGSMYRYVSGSPYICCDLSRLISYRVYCLPLYSMFRTLRLFSASRVHAGGSPSSGNNAKKVWRQFQPHSLCGLRPAKPKQSGGGFSCALPLRMRLSGCERSGCCAFLMVRRRCITIIVIRKRMKRGRRRSLSILTSRCSESCGGF